MLFFSIFILMIVSSGSARAQEADTTLITQTDYIKDTIYAYPRSQTTGQIVPDTSETDTRKLSRANQAAIYSAILPGLGQIYNKKYWKLPIIYGVGFFLAYQVKYTNDQYQEFRRALLQIRDNDPRTDNPYGRLPGQEGSINPYNNIINEGTLENRIDDLRRNRDMFVILTIVWYFLNVADAHIDVHLKDFDIDDNLSFKITPVFEHTAMFTPVAGIGFSLKF